MWFRRSSFDSRVSHGTTLTPTRIHQGAAEGNPNEEARQSEDEESIDLFHVSDLGPSCHPVVRKFQCPEAGPVASAGGVEGQSGPK